MAVEKHCYGCGIRIHNLFALELTFKKNDNLLRKAYLCKVCKEAEEL